MLPCIFGLAGPRLDNEERAFFRDADPAGYILFGRNVEDPEQLKRLTDDLRTLSGRERTAIFLDQEGGNVARLGPPHWPAFPAPSRLAQLYRRAPISSMEAARLHGLAIALALRASGINVALAPSLDVAHEGSLEHTIARSLGSDPVQVASLGRAWFDGLDQGGVAGTIKHMPGLGRAAVDSHQDLPVIDNSEDELEADLLPFRRLAPRARFGMTAHVCYTGWDAERPATLSEPVIAQAIRKRIGFQGLLLSDDIGMGALSSDMAARARGALAAGCDLVLHCSGDLKEAAAVADAVPQSLGEGRMDVALDLPDAQDELSDAVARRDALLALLD